MTAVRVPLDLWAEDDRSESRVVWLCPDGAVVEEGEVIAEILVDKTILELYAPVSGTLNLKVAPDIVIDRCQLVATID
jgi:pyruvate/2-oxoglutarate dehydrogenase complex dihydrolipoamide acyltransferase (E2) component